MMKKTMTCIICPLGCRIEVEGERAQGYSCPRGRDWARQEAAAPMRILTTTVPLRGGEIVLLPVRTRGPVPKDRLWECLARANSLLVEAPVRVGQVVCPDLAGTGVDLIATRTVAEIGKD